MYQDIEFDLESYKRDIGVDELMYSNKARKKMSGLFLAIFAFIMTRQ